MGRGKAAPSSQLPFPQGFGGTPVNNAGKLTTSRWSRKGLRQGGCWTPSFLTQEVEFPFRVARCMVCPSQGPTQICGSETDGPAVWSAVSGLQGFVACLAFHFKTESSSLAFTLKSRYRRMPCPTRIREQVTVASWQLGKLTLDVLLHWEVACAGQCKLDLNYFLKGWCVQPPHCPSCCRHEVIIWNNFLWPRAT